MVNLSAPGDRPVHLGEQIVPIPVQQSTASKLEQWRSGLAVWLGVLALHLATVLWASTFLVIKDAVSSVPPSLLICCRFALAALMLAPFLRGSTWALWRAGFESAVWFTLIYATQTIGLQSSSASRSAFISVLYVALVPLFLHARGRRVRRLEWWSVLLALLGIWLLTVPSGQATAGDAWMLLSVLVAALQLIRLEVLCKQFASWPLTAVTVCCGTLLSFGWLVADAPGMRIEWQAFPIWQVVYLGVVVTGLGSWLMLLGQARVSGVRTAVIFALEPVWAASLAAMVGERMALMGWVGGALVVGANILPNLWVFWYRPRLRSASWAKSQGSGRAAQAHESAEGAVALAEVLDRPAEAKCPS